MKHHGHGEIGLFLDAGETGSIDSYTAPLGLTEGFQMRRLLISDQYPHGHELGSILEAIRVEVLKGSGRITHDGRPETRHLLGHVLDCNMKVLGMLHEAKKAAAQTADSVLQIPLPKEPAQGPRIEDESALGPCHPPRNVG